MSYPETTRRPGWSALPVGLRAALADRLGAPVVATRAATAGFTRGFAGVLTAADGGRIFVKAAPRDSHLTDWYAREAAILDRLPPDVPAPRPRWTLHEAGWFALGLDVVDGHPPRHPWDPVELATILAAYADLAAALSDSPGDLAALDPPHLADLARDDILRWADVAAGREPVPGLPTGLERRLPELVALESRLPGYAAGAPGLVHGDLRPDNVLLERDGRAWFCDWTWLCHGPAWFDLVTLLLDGYAPETAGLDAAFAAHPAAAGAPPDALDVTLAALAGYFLTTASAVPATATGDLATHQRRSGEAALAWLAQRQGWD
ncbi:aminoglycoside phosphotransferase family protein [Micromonospora sp. NPDC126480]|uniref:aminoglycoside phosphotransferase family protein n=1 Tax=Micromonospora sp. NPDC126480 TaxID=3155312 RepID=UPI00331844A9